MFFAGGTERDTEQYTVQCRVQLSSIQYCNDHDWLKFDFRWRPSL